MAGITRCDIEVMLREALRKIEADIARGEWNGQVRLTVNNPYKDRTTSLHVTYSVDVTPSMFPPKHARAAYDPYAGTTASAGASISMADIKRAKAAFDRIAAGVPPKPSHPYYEWCRANP